MVEEGHGMTAIELRNVRKSFGGSEVIHGIDLAIEDGEFCVFVGPSGCGKSTLLRMIAGLEDITAGEVLIDDAVVNDIEPSARRLAMVFQSYALYPHMSVAGNMSFGLRMTGTSKAETAARVAEAARILQLDELMARKPAQLSGGQRQRVAIGRAIVRKPRAFLFDEPLSNLDAELRVQMRVEIAKLHQDLGATMIYVTHDQVEAMTLADKIVVLRAGVIEQAGTPAQLYGDPDNVFVAGFIGSPRMNLLDAEVIAIAGGTAIDLGGGIVIAAPADHLLSAGARVKVGIRPERFDRPEIGDVELPLTVDLLENLGGTTLVHAHLPGGATVVLEQRGSVGVAVGETLIARCDKADVMVFDQAGQRIRSGKQL
jgi:lactose/L-arabinose transport system ATP-binding protein